MGHRHLVSHEESLTIPTDTAEATQRDLEPRYWRLYPGGSVFLSRLQHSCFTDGGGVLQTGRDYWSNHDHLELQRNR